MSDVAYRFGFAARCYASSAYAVMRCRSVRPVTRGQTFREVTSNVDLVACDVGLDGRSTPIRKGHGIGIGIVEFNVPLNTL